MESMEGHFNNMRSYALGKESALLMASWPKGRPKIPFPYFSEVMTGFEYSALVGMIYEGMEDEALQGIKNIRDRYDGAKRSPFNEAECGHHYARAMASWASVLALTGFQYSAIDESINFRKREGNWFWSNGYSWGTVLIGGNSVKLKVEKGKLQLKEVLLDNEKVKSFKQGLNIEEGSEIEIEL